MLLDKVPYANPGLGDPQCSDTGKLALQAARESIVLAIKEEIRNPIEKNSRRTTEVVSEA